MTSATRFFLMLYLQVEWGCTATATQSCYVDYVRVYDTGGSVTVSAVPRAAATVFPAAVAQGTVDKLAYRPNDGSGVWADFSNTGYLHDPGLRRHRRELHPRVRRADRLHGRDDQQWRPVC